MKHWLKRHTWFVIIATFLIGGALWLIVDTLRPAPAPTITATVEEGTVRQLVSVSGAVRAEDTAELGFPLSGTVRTVHVRKGDVVEAGTPLVTLETSTLMAEVRDAEAAVAVAAAARAELISGATSEARAISSETVALKRTTLERTKTDEAQKVENARRALYSNDLTAYTTDADEDATAPTISGTFTCSQGGTYTLSPFRSGTESGYSLHLTGLESGTFPISTTQPIAFGSCGLRAQFTTGNTYQNTTWRVEVPNTKSSTYTTYQNAYELALANQKTAIDRAERELSVAVAEASSVNAPARSEAVAQANASVAQAQARLERAQANLRDATLIAPFAGTIVDVTTIAGASVTNAPVVTLLALDRLELTARVPEIDIGKLAVGQRADVVFDTAADQTFGATIDYLAPRAIVIDGVAYYEARLTLDERPAFIRGGLNADVDIIVREATGLRVPKRFVTETTEGASVLLLTSTNTYATTSVDITLSGNDGYVALTGLNTGDVIVAP